MKRKKSRSSKKNRSVPAKVQKLGASQTSPVREPEGASPPLAEVPLVLTSPPPSKPVVEAKSLSGATVEQPLMVMPITVWNPPSDNTKSPPRKVAEPKRRKSKPKVDEIKDSLLSNAELTAGAVSSIFKESDLGRSKGLPVDEALALSFKGVALVSL